MKRPLGLRIASAALGAALLGGTAAIAAWAEGDEAVEITVGVERLLPAGLSMTVAADSTTLREDGSDASARRFTGALPTVTVTDTRDAADIPPGAYWYVVGKVSDFTSGADTIEAENLGWTPALIDGGASGLVSEGMPVDPLLDSGPGLVDGSDLLAMAADSAIVNPEGQWTAKADLVLKTPTTVEPGNYSATLTLSLFE